MRNVPSMTGVTAGTGRGRGRGRGRGIKPNPQGMVVVGKNMQGLVPTTPAIVSHA